MLENPDIPYSEVKKYVGQYMPQKLYRYRTFDQYYKSNIMDGQVYLACPNTYNDPFDSAVKFDYKKCVEVLLGKESANLFPEVLSNDSELRILFENHYRGTFDGFKKYVKMACFSEKKDSILMWSHYAQNHKGFCIEYEFDESNTFYKHLHPIIYTKERYTTSKRDMSNTNGKWIYKTICRKSDVWSYEKEWRIVTVNFNKVMPDKLKYPNGKYVLDLKENIKAFYLGAKIEKKYKEEIIWFAKQNNVEVYQMNLSPDSYDLITKRMI